MPVTQFPIFSSFAVQRFDQFGAADCANWYLVQGQNTKKPQALYPCLGRRHINYFGENKLIFDAEPSQLFRSIDYMYAVVGTRIIQVDRFYNQVVLGTVPLGSTVWFDYLVVGAITYGLFTTGSNMYVITESTGAFDLITDSHAPTAPEFVATFGNRFVVSQAGTPEYYLSIINLGGNNFNPATCFTFTGNVALFNQASGIIRQFAVLHAQLYIFTDFSTDIWSNIPTQIVVEGVAREFPWRLNNSYNFNVGLANPFSLSVNFGRMVWLGQNISGLKSFLVSSGGMPQPISTEAVDVLLENSREDSGLSVFDTGPVNGFLYQWENTVIYRVSAGNYRDTGAVDKKDNASCLEFNFNTNTWSRAIELNGSRNRAEKHVYFNDSNLVSVQGDPVVYQFAGNVYRNEIRNPDEGIQSQKAFTKLPMRYELVTEQVYQEDYSEFITDYLEIDFVFGNKTFYKNEAPFDNTIFLTDEGSTPSEPIYLVDEEEDAEGSPIFLIDEDGNTPTFEDDHYNQLFKPNVSLYFSNNGGMTYFPADQREFSPLGNYRWRMRWYQLGTSRNRVYKLVCVSSAPIVILGAVHSIKRASGGAN